MRVARFVCPIVFEDRSGRMYRVSFRIAEEATWDHKFHDLAGQEIGSDHLWLSHQELSAIQSICDDAVGGPLSVLAEPRDLACSIECRSAPAREGVVVSFDHPRWREKGPLHELATDDRRQGSGDERYRRN